MVRVWFPTVLQGRGVNKVPAWRAGASATGCLRPERPILSAQAEGLGSGVRIGLRPCKGPFVDRAMTNDPFRVEIHVRSTLPGLRPGLTESALQAESLACKLHPVENDDILWRKLNRRHLTLPPPPAPPP